MNQPALGVIRPWEQPFWKPAKGKLGVLTYLVLIHVLAIVGVILYPVPSLKVFLIALGIAALGGFGKVAVYFAPIYLIGILAVLWLPETRGKGLPD